ncbi:GvpL/GvpF family gas vesicle protein [Streptomyces sp. NPDC097704]|uniref:GvpL/GvpF family gas vesicle protein n=1 Tax=Streptomyces sp. NPDC097704 TaxID=3157101 RepID=UPI0033316E14
MNGEPGLTYVYAVAAGTPRLDESLTGLRGVGDAPVTLLDPGRSGSPAPVFVVSRVPAGEWREEALRSRFEDLGWLEDTARAHHDVVQALTEHTTVLPLRLATLYQDDDRAREALREQQAAFSARLALLARHAEYGVKVYIAAEAATAADIPAEARAQPTAPAVDGIRAEAPAQPTASAADDPHGEARAHSTAPTDAPSPGKAYLRARRAQHHAREDRYLQARQAADRIAAIAAPLATHAVRHPAQTGPLTRGENGENVLNDAYLVPDEKAEAFRTALDEAGQGLPGIHIEVTGPWAPYSFAVSSAPAADTADRPDSRS